VNAGSRRLAQPSLPGPCVIGRQHWVPCTPESGVVVHVQGLRWYLRLGVTGRLRRKPAEQPQIDSCMLASSCIKLNPMTSSNAAVSNNVPSLKWCPLITLDTDVLALWRSSWRIVKCTALAVPMQQERGGMKAMALAHWQQDRVQQTQNGRHARDPSSIN
jgi:hypothetical protein